VADKYTKTVLTVIALALVYLCIVNPPVAPAYAQSSARPGEPTGPAQVVVVGVREPLPVALQRPAEVDITNKAVPIVGSGTTERSGGNADRVVLVGWEHLSTVEKAKYRPNMFQPFGQPGTGLPVLTR
jgi:hypothetical protein